MKNRKKSQLIRTITIALFFLLFLIVPSVILKQTERENKITYDKFLSMVNNEEIKTVVTSDNDYYKCIDKNNVEYLFPNPDYPEFKKDLLEKKLKNEIAIKTDYNEESFYNTLFIIIQILFMGGLFILLYKTTKKTVGKSTFGESNSKIEKQIPNVKFEDIGGLTEIKEDVEFIIKSLKEPEKFRRTGAKPPKGILLTGPPGTGKTLLAKAIAHESGVPFFYANGSSFTHMFVGVGAANVRKLFEKAKKEGKAIIFIDEIDSIGVRRTMSTNDEKDNTLNELLTQMDGFVSSSNILVIAATNRYNELDKALVRSGRFDKKIIVPLPTKEERLEIVKKHSKDKKFDDTVNFEQLARLTAGMSGSDIETILNDSAILASSQDKCVINNIDVDKAFNNMLLNGYERTETSVKNPKIDKLTAFHESGHAIVSKLCGVEVSKITINGTTSGAGGYTLQIPKEIGLMSKQELENQVMISYAGRAAEFILYNNNESLITTGASNDITQATKIIKSMLSSYGMGDNGLLDYSVLNNENPYTEKQNQEINQESIELSKKLYEQTKNILKSNLEMLNILSDRLIAKRTIYEEEFNEIFKQFCNENKIDEQSKSE